MAVYCATSSSNPRNIVFKYSNSKSGYTKRREFIYIGYFAGSVGLYANFRLKYMAHYIYNIYIIADIYIIYYII